MRISKAMVFLMSLTLYTGHAQSRFDITDFGAKGDGQTNNASYIQSAIDSCAASGGGVVIIPVGQFISGTIFLRDRVSLELSPGATLKGSPNIEDYPGERKHFMVGNKVTNLSISGMGTIDGNGYAFWNEDWSYNERPYPFILFTQSHNVSIYDVSIVNSPSHTIRIENCHHFKFDRISITNPLESQNTDGIDIVDSRNVTIANSYLSSGDDLICLKSQKDTVENVVVTNCILESDDAAIKFGTGSAVATRFNSFDNIIIRNTRYGISLFMLTGGIFEHNRFSNMIIETGGRHRHHYPVFIDVDKKRRTDRYGKIRHNVFENLSIVTGGKVLISGHPESPIEHLTLRDIEVILEREADFSKAKKPRGNKKYPKLSTSIDLSRENAHLVLSNIEGINLQNIRIHADQSTRKDYFKLNVRPSN